MKSAQDAIRQRDRVRRYLYLRPMGATRNEISAGTGILIQTLCRRLRELEQLDQINRWRRAICPKTGHLNIVYRLTGPARASITKMRERAA
ncbi:hypothetical protein [Alloalcanivorax xenomutans]